MNGVSVTLRVEGVFCRAHAARPSLGGRCAMCGRKEGACESIPVAVRGHPRKRRSGDGAHALFLAPGAASVQRTASTTGLK